MDLEKEIEKILRKTNRYWHEKEIAEAKEQLITLFKKLIASDKKN